MELDSQTITAFVLGLLVGLVVFAVVVPLLRQKSRAVYRHQLEDYEQTIVDLRQERADDRETNRRLRRELAVSTPSHFELTRHELEEANQQLNRLTEELRNSQNELAVRDRSLREARLAIQEIRVQLEGEADDGSSAGHSAGHGEADPGHVKADPGHVSDGFHAAPGAVREEIEAATDDELGAPWSDGRGDDELGAPWSDGRGDGELGAPWGDGHGERDDELGAPWGDGHGERGAVGENVLDDVRAGVGDIGSDNVFGATNEDTASDGSSGGTGFGATNEDTASDGSSGDPVMTADDGASDGSSGDPVMTADDGATDGSSGATAFGTDDGETDGAGDGRAMTVDEDEQDSPTMLVGDGPAGDGTTS